jgi:activator of Hsp90 ATPase-like protein
MEVKIEELDPSRHRFAYRWHPYAIDPAHDYSKETPTLVEFQLAEVPEGTQLNVTESGFDKVPEARRDEAFRMNTHGWEAQLKNIERHVTT